MQNLELAKQKLLSELDIHDQKKQHVLLQTVDSIAQIVGEDITAQIIHRALEHRTNWLKVVEQNKEALDNIHEFQVELLKEHSIEAPELPNLHIFDMASAALQLIDAFDTINKLDLSLNDRKKLKTLMSILVTGYLLSGVQKDIIKFIALTVAYKLIQKKCYAYVFPESITMDSFLVATNCKDEDLIDALSYLPFVFYWTKVSA